MVWLARCVRVDWLLLISLIWAWIKPPLRLGWYKPFKFYTGFYREEVLLHKILQRPFVYGDIGFQACRSSGGGVSAIGGGLCVRASSASRATIGE